MSLRRSPGIWLLLAVTLIIGLLPFLSANAMLRETLYTIFLAIALAGSLNIILGYTGYISFGHVVFFGLGGYVGMYLIGTWGLPLPLAVLGGGSAAALLAFLLGRPILKLRGAYFALVTIGVPAGRVMRDAFDGY